MDLGVGVFRDAAGRTPILEVVKDAERILLRTEDSKSYLGIAGDERFAALLAPIALGEQAGDDRIVGFQAPGGCGALRLAFELIARADSAARVLIGIPTWANHGAIIRSVGLQIVEYDYFEQHAGRIRFDTMIAALKDAKPGDAVLLHACCHNPTGADLDRPQWATVAEIIAERRLLPVLDVAYQGFGRGLDDDAQGLRSLLAACDEAIVAYSCDKNFGLYRERVGALFLKTASPKATARAMSHLHQCAREIWSMPPGHGAAVVRVILDRPELRDRWYDELEIMRSRINDVRARIGAADHRLGHVAQQFGMFSMLPLSAVQVLELQERYAIYMPDNARFNVVGLGDHQIDPFIQAVVDTLGGGGPFPPGDAEK